jgi:hypothetical protein
MFQTVIRRPKKAPHSAFQAMENENDEDDSHFDVHSSVSSSQMGPVEDADIAFLQLRVDDSLLGLERVHVCNVSMKELEVGKSNLLVDSSQLARSSTSKESRQIEIFRASEDGQPLDDTWSIQSISTITLFDQEVDEHIPVSITLPSMVGANAASSSTNVSQEERESRFHVLLCCLWNRDKSPSRSGERRPRRVAWFRQLPLFAKIGVVVFVVLLVVSIVTIAVSVADNNDEPDPSSTGSVEISATSPTNLSTATPVAPLMNIPTGSTPTASPTTTMPVCVDDTVATFDVNRVTRDCAWLSKSLALQVLLCRPGEGFFEVCRETCKNCPT